MRVFLASPGDVADERKVARDVLDKLRYDPSFRGKVQIEAVAWDTPGGGTPMLANLIPQEAIANGLPRPSECDIVVVVFWSRMGTPLPEDAGGEFIKPDGSRYWSGTEWEYTDAVRAADAGGRPDVLVYRRTEEPKWGARDPLRADKEAQWGRVEAFFAEFAAPDGSIRRGFNPYETPAAFEKMVETHLRERIARLMEAGAEAPVGSGSPGGRATARGGSGGHGVAAADLWQGSPFPGLRAFTEEDAPIYFGRTAEVDGLIRALADPATRFVAVVGASGSGKSSLVAAGLVPRLKANAVEGGKDWVLADRFTPGEAGGDPFVALAYALKPVLGAGGGAPREVAEHLRDAARRRAVVDAVVAGRPEWARLVVFVDQLEEVFTIVDARHRPAFLEAIVDLAAMEAVRVVATVRADFYDHCVAGGLAAVLRGAGTYPLAAADRSALRAMTTQPAYRAGLDFDDGLVDRVLDDAGSGEGSLALLAFALSELYERRSGDGRLTQQAYEAFGGVKGAIARRADATLGGLPTEVQGKLTDVFRQLVEVDERGVPTRRRVSKAQVEADDPARRLVEAFVDARLLVTDKGESPTVGVAHEALFTHWPRLAEWIEVRREHYVLLRQVRTLAAEWVARGKSRALLRPHEWLALLPPMLEQLQPDLTDDEEAFIRPEAERLQDELSDPTTSHDRRAETGDRLAAIGDPRPGVGLRPDGLPDIVWCEVPGGRVTIDVDRGEGAEFDVSPFRIAKYAVTWAQYRAFVEAEGGYGDRRWWDGLSQDQEPGEQYRQKPNCPAENVSWYDAVAFCRWLTARIQALGELAAGQVVRLPTEWEWQQAATGGNAANEFPWGPAWDSEKANTAESRLGRTVAGGMYPAGMSPVGALDMAGNVWEWCLNEYGRRDRIGVAGNAHRALRGGSWGDDKHDARSVARDLSHPHDRFHYIGFRVCGSSPIV
ncbi:hypothetical protein DCC79_03795 [bacterium]|nr:hypothetical protein [Chloroflexi bacterium CFX6]RIL11759.1 MAG: hypothetical protein DCC79_03795 [bacterium]